ncbi:6,7-dimethyl-8-ribityllumazine synthase [Roseinatronobacter sp. NSM]|uniref:6,7-dimethyl-8-ribityllumazine synthase n=1 Tax=Roseinatronobacter sp. NSM TaxID=3457785 RepID=UPI0040367B7D
MTDTLNVAFIKARWHPDIVDQTLKGFEADMTAAGRKVSIDIYDVPGAFEMPLLAKKLGETGRFDAIVAAALVVDGGIYRHDFVAHAVVTGLMDAQMATGVPTFSVSLTPHHFHDSEIHHNFFFDHFLKKGAEAAIAVRMVADLKV